MANLTDADKVLRNDVGKDIVTKLNNIATAIQTSGTTSLYVIADAFDSTATYDVGDYVIYNSSLYKCTTAVSVAGAFDPSDWEVVQVMDEIPDNLAGAIAMTQAQWDAIVDKTAWRNAHKNSYLIITDAPNLNPTASDIEYSSGVTVKQAIDGKENKFKSGDSFSLSGSYLCGQVSNNRYRFIFTIPLSRSAVGLTATLSGLSFALIGGGNYNTIPTGMTVTPAVDSITEVGLNCTLFFSADWTSLVNDDIFLIRIISGTVTFS